ncbi:MAG: ACT domain-containing protein [Planctomycetota bacterium]|jgi:hypothetical protein
MRKAKQISVCLENKPGRLARFCQCLAKRKVNIIAISVAETTEQGVVRMVVDKPAVALKTIAECGPMTCAQTDVLLVDLPNKVGVLGELAAKLASKRVNVNFVYGSTGTRGGKTSIVVGATNIKSAAKALRSRK